jgi:molybdopterin-dependent oxidoreductase alpha subunit
LAAVGRAVRTQQQPATIAKALLRANQTDGFDCPGCAWPDADHRSTFEFCENGAKAVAWEATGKTVGAEFFATHSVSALRERSDHWLEAQGRLAQPLRYNRSSDHYQPVSWDEAFAGIGVALRELPSPQAAAFYTSGRTSNEAAFLYQLFARQFGTNNLPDCSNLCHEATSIGLPQSIGVGKGTVQLSDFDQADAIFSFGHNPGTNHPRMLTTLRNAARRGARIVAFNPLRERGLERFQSPQSPGEMLTGSSTDLATHYFQPRIGSDLLVLQGMMKRVLELEALRPGKLLDHAFIGAHTEGFAALKAQLLQASWQRLCAGSGLTLQEFHVAADVYVAADAVIIAYGMGITQHMHGTANVQQLANLLLLRGNVGRPGAGICPVRGHSNVQGDRTVGINERPPELFLQRLDQEFAMHSPRAHGVSVIECIGAMQRGEIRALVSLGGNFAVAAPDPLATFGAMAQLEMHVGIHTKLNRSHLLHSRDAWILPCYGRSDIDLQASGVQSVSVEDSMSMVHASRGIKPPASALMRSEPAIVAGMAAATVPSSTTRWLWLCEDYSRIRDAISRVVPGFELYNERVAAAGGFHLPNAAAQRQWLTVSGRAQFLLAPAAPAAGPAGYPLQLTTIRSHDQYNTSVYGFDDRYRGIKGRRDVLFISAADITVLGLAAGSVVDVAADGGGGEERVLRGLTLVAYPIAAGCCAAYYPEASPLVALSAFDPQSRTPSFKSVAVRVQAAATNRQ